MTSKRKRWRVYSREQIKAWQRAWYQRNKWRLKLKRCLESRGSRA